MASGERLLLGFDFGFAYPYCDQQAYFPGHLDSPDSASNLWATVDTICALDNGFYGGSFYLDGQAPFTGHLCYQRYIGLQYHANGPRLRKTESISANIGAAPSTIFKCVGPDSVGISSIAGMRFLHHLKVTSGDRFAIWPFDDILDSHCVVVEIFPRLFFHIANNNPHLWRERPVLNNTLAFYGANELSPESVIDTEDKADAIVSSVALRSLATEVSCWSPKQMAACARLYEGWIFGVR